jgi:uncharacterized protein (DUF2384 family)
MSANQPKNDRALFDPQTGRLDAVRIAQDMGLPIDTLAKAIGLRTPEFRKHPDSSELQALLWPICRIWVALVDLYAGDKATACIFLTSPNRHLENRAPVAFIENGDLAPLELLIEAMSDRQPA